MIWNTVIFDLDGTLTESGDGIKKSFQYALAAMGRPVPDYDSLDAVVGPPLEDSFREIGGLNGEECDRAIELYRQRYTSVGYYESALYPGLTECLNRLKKDGMTLAVASSKPEIMVRHILSYFGIDHYFSVIVGSNMDGTRSRKKAVIDEALRRLNKAADRSGVVYVGDRKYDIVGSRECSLPSIGVTYGYGTFEELQAFKPTLMACSPEHLADLIIKENRETPGWAAGCSRGAVPVQSVPAVRRESAPHIFWRVIYPILLFFFVSNALSFLIAIGYVVYVGLTGQLNADSASVIMNHAMSIQCAADLIAMPFLIMFMRKDRQYRIGRNDGKVWLDAARLSVLWVLIAVVLFLASGNAFSYLVDLTHITEYDTQFQQFNSIAYVEPLILQILSIGIIGPVTEEIVFRGLIYRRIRDYQRPVVAVILSSVIFGAFHMNLTQGLFAFALGIYLALLYERTGRLILPIIGHMTNNLFTVLANKYAGNSSILSTTAFFIACLAVTVVLTVVVFVVKKPAADKNIPEKSRKSSL